VICSSEGVAGTCDWLDGPWSLDTIKWSVLVLIGDGSLFLNLELETVADLNRIGEISKENWTLVGWNKSLTKWVDTLPVVLKSISDSLLVV
tara:strand:- start:263 stop:535 length:273 start_codon:yes stop_codon:yes gene_type:complete